MAGFTLYEITGYYKTLQEMDGESADFDLAGALDMIEEQLEEKVSNIAKLVKCLEAESTAYGVEIDRMRKHAQAVDARVRGLRQYVLENLQAAGIGVLQAGLFKARVQNSPPSCEIVSEDQIPAEYRTERVVIDVDRRAIIEAWKTAGNEIPGVVVHQGQHLRFYP